MCITSTKNYVLSLELNFSFLYSRILKKMSCLTLFLVLFHLCRSETKSQQTELEKDFNETGRLVYINYGEDSLVAELNVTSFQWFTIFTFFVVIITTIIMPLLSNAIDYGFDRRGDSFSSFYPEDLSESSYTDYRKRLV